MTQGSGSEDGLSWAWLPPLQSHPACKTFFHPGSAARAERHLRPAEISCHLAGIWGGTGSGHCPACTGVSGTQRGQESPLVFLLPDPSMDLAVTAEHAIKLNPCQGRTGVGCDYGEQGMCGRHRTGFSVGSRDAGGR